ncbi:MAG: ABC transporter ATP-binding protein [Dehalobacterium sp.]
MNQQKVLEVQNVEKYYGKKGNLTKALDNISFSIYQGEFVGIMGASGSGKTTLLNCISTIDRVTAGHIIVGNNDISDMKQAAIEDFRRDALGFIFQDFNLLDTLTAYENVALALTIQKTAPNKIPKRVKQAAEQLDIAHLMEKFPYQLSGGEKQRVACARAIVTNPSLILADEPTGALDSQSARKLLDSLSQLNNELNATILMVTHDAMNASYANRILFINDGRLFNELVRGNDTRKDFFRRIIDVITLLGGDAFNVL